MVDIATRNAIQKCPVQHLHTNEVSEPINSSTSIHSIDAKESTANYDDDDDEDGETARLAHPLASATDLATTLIL